MGKYTLVGVDGNALAIMEYVIRALLRYILQNNKPTARDTTMKSKAVGVQQLTSRLVRGTTM